MLEGVWMVDANLTMGSVQSEAVGPYHPEQEPATSAEFRAFTDNVGHGSTRHLPP